MAAPDRRRDKRSGKFSSSYDDLGLFDLVAAVARHASPASPEKVSQPRWDAARAPAGYPDAPTARAIYGRLKMPWPQILAAALNDDRNVEQTLSAVRRVDKRKLTTEEVFYGLARVARELGRRSFSFYEYLRMRSELVAADRRRNGEEAVLDQVMPTAEQILNEYEDDWNAALTAHGFDPFTQPSGKRAMTIREAYDLLVELTGKAPQRGTFDEFRARYGVSIKKFAAGTTWAELDQELRAERAARGLDTPTVRLDLADWDAIEIPEGALDGVERRIVKGHWTYERILLALTDYLALPGIHPEPARLPEPTQTARLAGAACDPALRLMERDARPGARDAAHRRSAAVRVAAVGTFCGKTCARPPSAHGDRPARGVGEPHRDNGFGA